MCNIIDYGEAKFMISKFFNKKLLVIASERQVGTVFKFHKKTAKKYTCASCKSLGKSRLVTVKDGRIVGFKHPEDDHHPNCRPVPQESIDGLEIDRTMREDVRRTGKRPREAYEEAVATIPKRFKSTAEQEAVISKFPAYSEICRSLNRHRMAEHIPVPDPNNIPEELRVTIRGKSVTSIDENFNEQFLLYASADGKILVFCAESELELLHKSDYLVCDGTFEMVSTSSSQLYTIHGFYKGESLPLAWALLPNKSRKTYVEIFKAIRDAAVQKFGVVQQPRTFLTDFEAAAVDAIREVFPGDRVKGCTFHFRQALMRHVGELGLKTVYSSPSGDPQVQSWIRCIMGLTLLPEVFMQLAWQMLKHPPVVGDEAIRAKLIAFSAYFERTWLVGSFPPSLWSHYDNAGPRTTNNAEGWHNLLNHSLRMPHPSLTNFLHWLRRYQFQVQCRIIQLKAGRPAKPQSPV